MSKGLGQLERRCLEIVESYKPGAAIVHMLDVANRIAAPAAPTPSMKAAVRRSLRSLARKGRVVIGERSWMRQRPVYTPAGAKACDAFVAAFVKRPDVSSAS